MRGGAGICHRFSSEIVFPRGYRYITLLQAYHQYGRTILLCLRQEKMDMVVIKT